MRHSAEGKAPLMARPRCAGMIFVLPGYSFGSTLFDVTAVRGGSACKCSRGPAAAPASPQLWARGRSMPLTPPEPTACTTRRGRWYLRGRRQLAPSHRHRARLCQAPSGLRGRRRSCCSQPCTPRLMCSVRCQYLALHANTHAGPELCRGGQEAGGQVSALRGGPGPCCAPCMAGLAPAARPAWRAWPLLRAQRCAPHFCGF